MSTISNRKFVNLKSNFQIPKQPQPTQKKTVHETKTKVKVKDGNDKDIKDNINDKDNINVKDWTDIDKIKYWFLHYSNNQQYQTNRQFMQWLSETQLLDNVTLNETQANTWFYSFSKAKSTIQYPSFFGLIQKICEMKTPETYHDKSQYFPQFVYIYITPILNIIQSTLHPNTIVPDGEHQMNYQLLISKISTAPITQVIEENYLLFKLLYDKYFCFEKLKISKTQKRHLSLKALWKVAKDFELSPSYVTMNQVEEIYENVLNNVDYCLNVLAKEIKTRYNNIGMYFTLFHFIIAVYLMAIVNILTTNREGDGNQQVWEIFVNGTDTIAFKRIIIVLVKVNTTKGMCPEIRHVAGYPAEGGCVGELGSGENKMESEDDNGNYDDYNRDRYWNEVSESKNNNAMIKMNYQNQNQNEESKAAESPNNAMYHSYNNNINKTGASPYNSKTPVGTMQPNSQSLTPLRNPYTNNPISMPDETQAMTISDMSPIVLTKYYSPWLSIYKFYSEWFYETNFSIFMTQNGFIKLLREIGWVDTTSPASTNPSPNKTVMQIYLQNKLKNNLLPLSSINFIFSKFSSSHQNTCSSNKRINFESFIHIILCLSNKIYNPLFNCTSFDNRAFMISSWYTTDFPLKYAFSFIESYVVPWYNDMRVFIEDEVCSPDNLNYWLNTEDIREYSEKLRNVLMKMWKVYTDGREIMCYGEYFKFLTDFEIFPDWWTRMKMIKIFITFTEGFDRDYIIKGNNKVVSPVCVMVNAIMFMSIGCENNFNNGNQGWLVRMVHFCQRMIQAKGIEMMTRIVGNNKIAREFIQLFKYYKSRVCEEKVSGRNSWRVEQGNNLRGGFS